LEVHIDMIRSMIAAAIIGVASSVTPDTNTPTTASNYMVLQGDFEYVAGAADMGAISGRAQLVRSALSASSKFAFSIKMEAAPNGAQLEAVVKRHSCEMPSSTPYQDPYRCPGYNQITDANSCESQVVGTPNSVEARMSCIVDGESCNGALDWGIYIAEEYEGQRVFDLSVGLNVEGAEFACANLRITRDTTATEASILPDANGNMGELALGGMQKDELGYTHVSFIALALTPETTYGAFVADGSCFEGFSEAQPLGGLSTQFSTDAAGSAKDAAFYAETVVGPEAQALVVTDCLTLGGASDPTGQCEGGSPRIMCYDFELLLAPSSRAGGVVDDVDAEERADTSSCAMWAGLYSGDSVGNGGKKGGKHGYAFGDFDDRTVNGATRCCLSQQYLITTGKKGDRIAKMSAMTGLRAPGAGSRQAFVGLGAGVCGAVVLAAGVAMHIRRRHKRMGEERYELLKQAGYPSAADEAVAVEDADDGSGITSKTSLLTEK